MSDTHDMTPEQVAAMPLWRRIAFHLQPFNSAGLKFANVQEWADWAGIVCCNHAEEFVDKHKLLTEFLERENADLRAELNDLRVRVASRDIAIGTIDDILEACAEVLGHDVVLVELPGELAALRAELDGVRKDAERYRWLREPQEHVCVEVEAENEDGYTNTFYCLIREELDAAIDAAIAQGKGEK